MNEWMSERRRPAVGGENGPVASALSYHGLHRLPALGLGSRQQEIFGIPSEIHLQIDVEVHCFARLSPSAYYTRRTRSVFPDQRGLSGLISPIRSTVTYPTGDEAYFVFTSASWARPPCTMCPEQRSPLPLVRTKQKRRGGSARRKERRAAELRLRAALTPAHCRRLRVLSLLGQNTATRSAERLYLEQ